MNNISDFFRDPRLDDFDDPQEGVTQLDDLMDPVQPKVANKMVRFFSGSLTAGAAVASVTIPDGVLSLLKITPEYWIVRVAVSSNQITFAKPLLIQRQGGDDLSVVLAVGGSADSLLGPEKRYVLPGQSAWIKLTLPIYSLNAPVLFYTVAACTGYNPNEIF